MCPPAAAGCDAVCLIRFITWSALRSGNRSRTSAASPATYGAAKLVPWIGDGWPSWSIVWFASPLGLAGSSEMISVPGAATLTHGPWMENSAGSPLRSIAATEST